MAIETTPSKICIDGEKLFQDMRICYGCLLDFNGPNSLYAISASRNKKLLTFLYETDEYLLSEERSRKIGWTATCFV